MSEGSSTVNDFIRFDNGISIRYTEPHSSERLLTLRVGDQEATLSRDDTEQLYMWLYEHRMTFISFYGKAWKLAEQYWQAEGAPDNYYGMLALFNAHCHEIGIAPYHDGDKGPSELAMNGFIAAIHNIQWEQEKEPLRLSQRNT